MKTPEQMNMETTEIHFHKPAHSKIGRLNIFTSKQNL